MADRQILPKTINWQAATDAELLQASAQRNQQAFAVIVARYHAPVYRVAWRLNGGHVDTDDIAQETFLKLWNNPAQLREAGALNGWLMRVASNLVMDRYRQKPMLELDYAKEGVDPAVWRTVRENKLCRQRQPKHLGWKHDRYSCPLTNFAGNFQTSAMQIDQ